MGRHGSSERFVGRDHALDLILRAKKIDARAEMLGALDPIVLDGARRMLAAVLEAEADAYIARLAGEVDDRSPPSREAWALAGLPTTAG